MELRQFRTKMARARKKAVYTEGFEGVCFLIMRSVGRQARDIFSSNFQPDEPTEHRTLASPMWLNTSYVMNGLLCNPFNNDGLTNLERRLMFLDAFQGYVESEKLYENW